jgi:hypothetical protein
MKKRGLYMVFIVLSVFLVLLFYRPFSALAQETVSQQNIINNSLFDAPKSAIFDIIITIPNDYKIVNPGDQLLATIKLVNLGSAGRIDVSLDYWIADSEQNILLENKETVAVETQASFVKTFVIPADAKSGQYSLNAKLTYSETKQATAGDSFKVAEKQTKNQIDNRLYYVIIGIIVLVILIYIIFKSRSLFEKLRIRAEVSRIVRNKKI